ncbi:hypothetical protein ACFTS5_07985 [Nocardia sp. NPDC056952]|uniref:hypothetical protein n=1 Tax=Nocardia sp. NPDC056952 TaxID=3345979 RepID=UPI00362AB34B
MQEVIARMMREAKRSLTAGELGNLAHRVGVVVVSSRTYFDPSAVCTARNVDVARRCAEVAGAALLPIGVDSFHLTLYSGSDGQFYAGFDSSVYRYADDRDVLFSMLKDGIRPLLLGQQTLQ